MESNVRHSFDQNSDHRASPNLGKSTEDDDHLIRSTKKINSANQPTENELAQEMAMETEVLTEVVNTQEAPDALPPPKSFKEALTAVKNSDYLFDAGVDILSSDEEDDEERGISTTATIHSEHMRFPMISLPKKLLEKIRKPWENALIVRLLEKNIGYKMLCTRVAKIWGLQGEFNAIDLVLYAIEQTIGKPLKIDWTTSMATRGKFAQICVEMDLTKPLKPKFILEGRYYNIEYESLHSFCFLCGQIDHRKEACRFKEPPSQPSAKNLAVFDEQTLPTGSIETNGNLQHKQTEEEAFGPWMLATKRGRRAAQHKKAQISTNPTLQQNRFKYLDDGLDGQGESSRGKKTTRAGLDKAQGEHNPQIGPLQYNDPKGKTKIGLVHHKTDQSDLQQKHSELEWRRLAQIKLQRYCQHQKSVNRQTLPGTIKTTNPIHTFRPYPVP
ncbi:unnamed protein product [Camellia sinensis]